MKEVKRNEHRKMDNNNLEVSCGNCWGHQQYEQGYREKKLDYWRHKRDNFLSKFVKRYLN